MAIALIFTLAYGSLGFYRLDRQYSTTFRLAEAVKQTLAIFFTDNNLGIQPTSRFGSFFINSIYIIGAAVTLLYALWMLLRPVLL